MKIDKILRLIMLRDTERNVVGFIALRENGVSSYGFNESFEEKRKVHGQLMNELVQTYPSNLEELIKNKDIPKIREVLVEEGYLIDTTEPVITKLTTYKTDGDYYFEVEYAYGDKKTLRLSDFADEKEYLKNYNYYIDCIKKTYRITNISNFKCFNEVVDLRKTNSTIKVNNAIDNHSSERYHDSYDDHEDYDDNEIKIEKNQPKKRHIKIGKKLVALALAGVTLVVVHNQGIKKGKEINNELSSNEITFEDIHIIEPTLTPYTRVTAVPVIPSTKSPNPTNTPTPLPFPTTTPPVQSKEIYTVYFSDGSTKRVTTNDLDVQNINLEDAYNTANKNFEDLTAYVFHSDSPLEENHQLNYPKMVVHYENLVTGLTVMESKYLEHFSDLRNKVISLGYDGRYDEALEANRNLLAEGVRYIANNQSLTVLARNQMRNLNFNGVSQKVQDAVKSIIWGSSQFIDVNNPINVDGENYDQQRLLSEIFGLVQEPTPKF